MCIRDSSVSQNNVAAYTTYGTSRANAYKILEEFGVERMNFILANTIQHLSLIHI